MTTALELPVGPFTLDDVTELGAVDDRHRFELSEGNLIVMPPGTWRHQKIGLRLYSWLAANGFEGRVNIAPGVRTAVDDLNGRILDLVVTKEPVSDDDGTVWLAPEAVALAVEIVSPGSERTDRWFKPLEYAEAGITRFWRVEPDDTVSFFRLDGKRYVEDGSIALDALLAGDVPDLA